MLRRQIRTLAVLVLVLAAFTACATGSAVQTGETMNVQIQVDNNLRNIQGVSVFLVSNNGSRRSLGPVESNQKASYDRAIRAGDYHLIATRLGDSDIVSQTFRVDTDNLVVIWALGQNQLTFGQR